MHTHAGIFSPSIFLSLTTLCPLSLFVSLYIIPLPLQPPCYSRWPSLFPSFQTRSNSFLSDTSDSSWPSELNSSSSPTTSTSTSAVPLPSPVSRGMSLTSVFDSSSDGTGGTRSGGGGGRGDNDFTKSFDFTQYFDMRQGVSKA